MFRSYLKIAVRNLRKHSAYSVINVLGLAVGMACCVLIILFVQDELSYDRYHEKSDRIFRITESGIVGGKPLELAVTPPLWGPTLTRDYPEVVDWVRLQPPQSRWLIRYEDTRFYEKGFIHADSSVFEIFSFPLVSGNPKTALAAPNTAVISESMAAKYFGDEDPLGKTITADAMYTYSITGVMRDIPQNTHFQCDFLASFATLEAANPITFERGGGLSHQVYTYLLLQEGYDPADLAEKIPGFLDKYIGEQLKSFGLTLNPYLTPVADIHLYSNVEDELGANSDIRYVYIFSSLAFVILLIACINFMNLATARSAHRAQEVGMRKVLGAYRSQLIGQFIGESMLLSAIALVTAIGLVYTLLPLFNNLAGKQLELAFASSWLLPALVGIALSVGVLAGGYPAFFLSSFRPVAVLQGALKAGASNAILRKILVVVQFAISIAMIVGTGAVYSQLNYMQNKSLGFDREHVILIPMPDEAVAKGYDAFKNALQQYPAIVHVGTSLNVPGGRPGIDVIRPEGVPEDQSPTFQLNAADYDYVDAVGLDIIEGRNFSREFSTDSTACLINEAAVRSLRWDNPIGKEFFRLGGPPDPRPLKVIGVLRDFHNRSLHQPIEPFILYFSGPQAPHFMVVKVHGEDLSGTLGILQDQWSTTFPNHPPMEHSFLDEDFEKQYMAEQRMGSVFVAVAILSITIACLGLFGLASFMAEQRTKEIGVRKVLGATVSDIVVLLSRDFTRLVAVAFIVGAPVIYFVMNEWLQEFPYRTDMSIWLFVAAGLAAFLIAGITVGYQALKAAWTNPADALHHGK